MTTLRLLIDACLTPAVLEQLESRFGAHINVRHVDRVLPPASTDAAVLSLAATEDRVLVTANARDFLKITHVLANHPGLGLVTEQNTRARQINAVLRLVSALQRRTRLGKPVRGHAVLLTRANKIVVRRMP